MPKIFNKFMSIIGGVEDDYEEDDRALEEDDEDEEEKRLPIAQSRRGSKIVNMYENNYTKVSIVKMEKYDDTVIVCNDLKARKIVVFNTTLLESREAQRSIDFICGATFVLEADLSEIEKGVYIASPSNVEVSKDIKDSFSSTKNIFNWSR